MDFVIIANAWDAAIDNPTSKHQIALELVKQGHRVLWVEGAGMRKPSLESPADRGRMAERIRKTLRGSEEVMRNIWRIAPLIISLPKWDLIRNINDIIYNSAICSAIRDDNFNNPILINFMPTIPGVMTAFEGFSVYYCVDRWDAFGMYDSALMARLDKDCCRNADMVIASSKDLFERCIKLNPKTYLVTHGVDYKHFAASLNSQLHFRPADLPDGKVIGFIGLISEWVNQDLIVKLAQALADSHIVLIGKADVQVDRLKREPNIHILGPRLFRELPAYVAAFDVGIIPFVVNNLTRAVNPIKLKEMLSAGCPVVSTDLPEVAELSFNSEGKYRNKCSYVAIGKSEDEFIKLVKERVDYPLTIDQKQLISMNMKNETWEEKVKQILGLIETAKQQQS
ncbi:MAG: glycosyltransferase [Kiritimatiellae bacterium]|nr:glycosyltransferase [Kiritimatiellia bacterium]MDD5521908.1 glycosyltransferase [Kiritimatiellia bacterium]